MELLGDPILLGLYRKDELKCKSDKKVGYEKSIINIKTDNSTDWHLHMSSVSKAIYLRIQKLKVLCLNGQSKSMMETSFELKFCFTFLQINISPYTLQWIKKQQQQQQQQQQNRLKVPLLP